MSRSSHPRQALVSSNALSDHRASPRRASWRFDAAANREQSGVRGRLSSGYSPRCPDTRLLPPRSVNIESVKANAPDAVVVDQT